MSGSRAACIIASAAASRRLQFATRFCERHSRQPPRRFGFGTQNRPHSLCAKESLGEGDDDDVVERAHCPKPSNENPTGPKPVQQRVVPGWKRVLRLEG